MSTIGLIYMSVEEEVKADYLEEYQEIALLSNKAELFERLNQFEGVIIVEEEKSKLGETCELIMTIKKQSACFIWLVSALEKDTEKLVYLQLGVDFVINKKSSKMEKELIVKNSMRRSYMLKAENETEQPNVALSEENDMKFDLIPENLSVRINGGTEVSLTKLEFQLLGLLFENPRVTFTYEALQKHLYGNISEDRQYRITNLMYHLRKKINKVDDPKNHYIKTVRSRGYMFTYKKSN